MSDYQMQVPTYHGESDQFDEFDKPWHDITVESCDGMSLTLQTAAHADACDPSLIIERRPNGWVIVIDGDGSGDGLIVSITDQREMFACPSCRPSRTVEYVDEIPKAVDHVPQDA